MNRVQKQPGLSKPLVERQSSLNPEHRIFGTAEQGKLFPGAIGYGCATTRDAGFTRLPSFAPDGLAPTPADFGALLVDRIGHGQPKLDASFVSHRIDERYIVDGSLDEYRCVGRM